MSTLHYGRVRRDMIEIYKILSGKYDTNVVANLKTTGIQATRGNDLRMCKTRFKYDLLSGSKDRMHNIKMQM